MTPPLTTTLDPAIILERIYIERDFFLGNEKRARDAAIEDAKDFAQPAPPTEAQEWHTDGTCALCTGFHDWSEADHMNAGLVRRRYLAATEEGT